MLLYKYLCFILNLYFIVYIKMLYIYTNIYDIIVIKIIIFEI